MSSLKFWRLQMKPQLSVLVLVILLTVFAALPGAAAPLAGPCVGGGGYSPACDVDQNGQITVTDIQLTAGHWNQSGTYISDNNHNHLGQTWTGGNPLILTGSYSSPDSAPLVLSNSTGDGVRVSSASATGVYVDSAGLTGVYVASAPRGVHVGSVTQNGVRVNSAGDYGVYVDSAGNGGVRVWSTGGTGVQVDSADRDGVWVGDANDDGLAVCATGAFGGCSPDTYANGVEVGNAEDYGAKVIFAGRAAFRSENSGTNAFYAYDAGDSGVWIRAAANWAGYFTGDINVTGNCTGCLLAQIAVNSGKDTLQPGDILAVDGIAASPFDGLDMLMLVRQAAPGIPLVGVVSGRAEPFTSSEDGTNTLVPRAGEPAAPGEYLSVVIYGPVQVKAAGDVQLGDRVTVDATGGVRALAAFQVQRMDGGVADMLETAPVLGIALEAAKDGKVWVLVNPQ
jgi:hypothetical protein